MANSGHNAPTHWLSCCNNGKTWGTHQPINNVRPISTISNVHRGLPIFIWPKPMHITLVQALKDAGLDYYNHNLDTSPDYYKEIITTRSYQDRLDTLEHVRAAGIKVCCGGIVGMGETREQRAGLIAQLAALPTPPESVPINQLIPIPGTPLEHAQPVDVFEFVRTIAVTRVMLPISVIRLSAGREALSNEAQAMCFLAGANSIFYGDTLLTAENPEVQRDRDLMARLQLQVGDHFCE